MKVKEESEKVGLQLNIQKAEIMASGPITSWQIDRGKETDFIFLGSKITVDSECSHEIKRRLVLGRKAMTNLDSVLKKQRHHFASKGPYSPSLSSSHLQMWNLDHKEGWVLKNWCFWTVVLGKTLESPLDSKDIKAVNPKGNQSWIFIGRTDVEAEAPILWPPDAKGLLIGKKPWCWERLKAGGEGDNKGWDGWMVSLIQWTWVWGNLGRLKGQGILSCCST